MSKPIDVSWKDVVRAKADGGPAYLLAVCNAFLSEQPQHGPCLLRKGEALVDMARYEEALVAMQAALENWGTSRQHLPLRALGHLEKARGRFEQAEEWYRRSIAIQPADAGGYVYLGACLAVQGRLEEAEACHRRGATCDSGAIDEAFLNLGLVLRAQGKFVEAEACFRRALDIDPRDSAAAAALEDIGRAVEFGG